MSSKITFGSRTDVGRVREQNEDSLIVEAPLFVVADGMGGHAAGEVASEIAVKTIAECAPEYLDAEELGQAVEIANRDIINAALAGKGREGMGTTCTAVMVEGNRLVIAQVGDSRAYLLHQGKLNQLTRDHSLMADMIEAGEITPEMARFHPQRSVITRALGSDVKMVPDLYEITMQDGDRILICSDGLYSMVSDANIEEIMNREGDPQACADALVEAALEAGGTDNVTVIVVNPSGSAHTRQSKVALKTKVTVGVILGLLIVLIAAAFIGGNAYLHSSAYLAESPDGYVEVYRGVPGEVMGFSYSELVETTDIPVADLSPSAAKNIQDGMRLGSLQEAQSLVDSYREQLGRTDANATLASSASSTASASNATASTASASADAASDSPEDNS